MSVLRRTIAAASTAAVLVTAGPAFAAGPPYTVKVGSNTSGTYDATYAKVRGTTITFSVNGYSAGCTNLIAPSTVLAGARVEAPLTVTSLNFSGCSFNASSLAVNLDKPVAFVGTGTNATAAGADIVRGYLRGVTLRVTSGGLCSYTLSGSVNASFDESTQQLRLDETPASSATGNLKITSVRGCAGVYAVGNAATLQATLAGQPGAGPVSIS